MLGFALADDPRHCHSRVLCFPITASSSFETTAVAHNSRQAESADRLAKFIEEASDRFAVRTRWIRAVIEIESGDDEHAISPRGAMGLMQLVPGTWLELSVRYGLGLDITTTYFRGCCLPQKDERPLRLGGLPCGSVAV